MSPEARVFRPRSEREDQLIGALMETHAAEKDIEKPSWTQYVSYLLNRDMAEIRAKRRARGGA